MIGGLRGATSRYALAVAVGAVMAVAFVGKPALAADLGGDCCADLEERVAELEATTVRKGNKKVSVQIYGKLNRFVAAWDDGAEKNVYVDNNSYSSSRFGIRGKAKIGGEWSAGYRMEWEDTTALSKNTNQFVPGDDPGFGGIITRHSYWYIDNKNVGQLRMGLTSTAKDDITKDTHVAGEIIDTMHSDFYLNRAFFLRPQGFNTEAGLSDIDWGDITRCYSTSSAVFDCSTRRNNVAFWSKKVLGMTEDGGFWGSWAWGEDDIWSLALRYEDEWGKMFKVGGGIGYESFTDERVNAGGGGLAGFKRDLKELAGSASIMHIPTGLFVFGAFSSSENNDTGAVGAFTGTQAPDMDSWDVSVGIQKEWWALGETTLWGGYTRSNDGIAGFTRGNGTWDGFIPAGDLASVTEDTQMTGAQVDKWYLAADQHIESAAMSLYIAYQHIEGDMDLVDSALNPVSTPIDDFDVIFSGARIYF